MKYVLVLNTNNPFITAAKIDVYSSCKMGATAI